jgi:hypothetical protein
MLASLANASDKGDDNVACGQRSRHPVDQTFTNDFARPGRKNGCGHGCGYGYLRLYKVLKFHLIPPLSV